MPATSDRLRQLLILLPVLLLGPWNAAVATDGVDRGLLWQVEHDGADQPSHVFGTIHSTDERVHDLPAEVEAAFADARSYHFEIDFSRMLEDGGLMRMFYLDGRRLPNKLDEGLWERTREAARAAGVPEQNLTLMKPWAVAIMVSVPQEDPTQVLDYQLYERASAKGRPVAGLETVDEQIGIFDDLALETQIEMLERALEYFEDGRVDFVFERMIELYLERDLAGLANMAEENPALPGPDDQEALMRRLVDERNRILVTRMESALQEGGAFVAVGALHLPGENGIVRLLEARGYTVTSVY